MRPVSWIGNWSGVEGSNGTCKDAGPSEDEEVESCWMIPAQHL